MDVLVSGRRSQGANDRFHAEWQARQACSQTFLSQNEAEISCFRQELGKVRDGFYASVQNLQTNLKRKIQDRTLDEIVGGDLSSSYWKPKIKLWEGEILNFESELNSLSLPPDSLIEKLNQFTEHITDLKPYYHNLQNGLTKTQLIKMVVSNLEVGHGKLEPIYKYPFNLIAKRTDLHGWYLGRESNPHARKGTGF